MLSDNTKIGILMMGLGFLFLFLGVMLFFDSALLAIGNILVLVSFPFMIGFRKTLSFFDPRERPGKVRGILCFFGGIILVLFRWPIVGMIVELFGALLAAMVLCLLLALALPLPLLLLHAVRCTAFAALQTHNSCAPQPHAHMQACLRCSAASCLWR